MITIHILNGSEKGQSFEIEGDAIHLGRSSANDIKLKDNSISRRHLCVRMDGDTYYVKDLKSTNGTVVQGLRITPETEVEVTQGIPIAIGNIFFSIDRPYEGNIDTIEGAMDLSQNLEEGAPVAAYDRPMTPARNMEFVFKVCEALMQSTNINKTLEMVLNYIFQLLERVDRGVIILVDIETGNIADIICSYEKNRDETVMMYSRSIVDRVLESKKPAFMTDTQSEDKTEISESMEMMKIRSVMCVPLISRGQIRGVIYVDSVNQPFGFRKEDLKLLTALSSPAAIAVENALLHSTLELMAGDNPKKT
ncbi:FHA domain-containing protein [Thermodesulfobacteriota bacterium]